MSVPYCQICESDPSDSRSNLPGGLDGGEYCPVCHQPTCRNHLFTVRWRWKKTGVRDAARVCMACKTAYRHRDWDPINRDWIS